SRCVLLQVSCCVVQCHCFLFFPFFFHSPRVHRDLHSFPTRRSSDLGDAADGGVEIATSGADRVGDPAAEPVDEARHLLDAGAGGDRKSTRLNSSHEWISYAVFCLKKKTEKTRLVSAVQVLMKQHSAQ